MSVVKFDKRLKSILVKRGKIGEEPLQECLRKAEEGNGSLTQVGFMNPTVFLRKRAVDLNGLNAASAQAVHLIFHQGYERRNYHGRIAAQDCRRLVAQRLAASGW